MTKKYWGISENRKTDNIWNWKPQLKGLASPCTKTYGNVFKGGYNCLQWDLWGLREVHRTQQFDRSDAYGVSRMHSILNKHTRRANGGLIFERLSRIPGCWCNDLSAWETLWPRDGKSLPVTPQRMLPCPQRKILFLGKFIIFHMRSSKWLFVEKNNWSRHLGSLSTIGDR